MNVIRRFVKLIEYIEFQVNIKMTEQPTFDIEGPTDYNICSCGQHSMSVAFTITPNIIGDIEITVVVSLLLIKFSYFSLLFKIRVFFTFCYLSIS